MPAPAPASSRTVLVTGGAGFVGRHLHVALRRRGVTVLLLDDLSAPGSRGQAARAGASLLRADVRDARAVAAAVGRADEVVHLASVVGVDAVTADPSRTVSVIRDGTARVLEAARARGLPLTAFSTSEVTDELRRGPRAGYGRAKADAEDLLLAAAHELPVTVVRPFNVVGPGQSSPGAVLPAFLGAIRRGAPLPVHDDGSQQRAFLHVSDLVEALVALMQRPAPPGGRLVEIGAEGRTSVASLAARLVELARHRPGVAVARPSAGREERPRRPPDLTALRREVDLRPRLGLDEILREALAAHGLSPGLCHA